MPERPAAGDPVADYTKWEDIYSAHDGLGPDELDIEVEFEERSFTDKWTTFDKCLIGTLVFIMVASWFAALAGWIG